MNGPIFHEFKKQASFFLKEKIKTARLALTDVTPAQLFVRFERRDWRALYKALIVLENLLTHGPERVAEEFQGDRDVIKEMANFQHIDDRGFDWGLNVRKKSERVLKLLERGHLLREERDKARKVSRGIQGFGSFSIRASSDQEILQESSVKSFNRSISESISHTNQEDLFSISKETERKKPFAPVSTKMEENSRLSESKENHAPKEGVVLERDCIGENKPLLGEKNGESGVKTSIKDHHPFQESKFVSLLSGADELQAC